MTWLLVIALIVVIVMASHREGQYEVEARRLKGELWEAGRERREREQREQEDRDRAFHERLLSEPALAESWYTLQEPFMPDRFERKRWDEPYTEFWRRHHDEAQQYWTELRNKTRG
jgi:hypothetical protein